MTSSLIKKSCKKALITCSTEKLHVQYVCVYFGKKYGKLGLLQLLIFFLMGSSYLNCNNVLEIQNYMLEVSKLLNKITFIITNSVYGIYNV